jgi:hypothetical protein
MLFRGLVSRIAKIFTTVLVLSAFPLALQAQTSEAGAMKANGNFFVLKPSSSGISVIEWNESASSWQSVGLISGATICSAPRALTSSGGFYTVCSYFGSQLNLIHWEPNSSVTNLGSPGTGMQMSAPSDVMYGNRVYVIGQAGANSGSLFERFYISNWSWFNFGSPTTSPLRASPPAVLRDGNLFVSDMYGDAWQMWWNTSNNTWNWHNHGQPFSPYYNPYIKVLSIGAAMPDSSKVFATCSDGTLRQIYYNGSSWIWYNHGNPFGYNVDSQAAAIAEGKLFVTGSSGDYHVLLQLYWNGSMWVWYNHGWPSGTTLLPNATTTRGASQVVLKAINGNFYETYWTGSAWAWKNLGAP